MICFDSTKSITAVTVMIIDWLLLLKTNFTCDIVTADSLS